MYKPLVAAAALLALLQSLYTTAVRFLLRRNIDRYRNGDPGPLLKTFADDVHFVFPGESSWRVDVRGKDAAESWQRRFLATGLQFEPQTVSVSGPPWNTAIALKFSDHLDAPNGERVYNNEGVIFGKARWGKVVSYTVYEDTQKLPGLDEYLGESEATAA
jgi:ketosteroid isomerase-like protein